MENENKNFTASFSEIMVLDHGMCDHDFKKEIEIIVKLWLLFSVIVFNMMMTLYLHRYILLEWNAVSWVLGGFGET